METYHSDVIECFIWDLQEASQRCTNGTSRWDVLVTYHWDVVGCFIWDLFETSKRRTDGTLRPLQTLWWWWWWWIVFVVWLTDERQSLISSWDHCQRSSPSRISDTSRAGFEPAQNLSSGFDEWSFAVVITTTPCSNKMSWRLRLRLLGDVPPRRTERRCDDVATTSCCHVGKDLRIQKLRRPKKFKKPCCSSKLIYLLHVKKYKKTV